MSYVTGKIIRELREKKNLTQKELGDALMISDKTVSKWENDRGLPDIGLIGDLAQQLGVSVAELLVGEYAVNQNRSANMKKTQFYVCPICQNIIHAIGNGSYSCCGILLPALEVEEEKDDHQPQVEIVDNEFYVHLDHPMKKDHYISFMAYVTSDAISLVKLYPEQNCECRFARRGHGYLYYYCNKHGLFRKMV